MSEVIGVQFPEGGRLHYYFCPGPRPQVGSLCVVETEHGPSMAKVMKVNLPVPDRKTSGPLRRLLRTATSRDLEQRKSHERLEREAYRLCQDKVLEKKLSMKLVDVAYLLDGRKAVFYFTAENRVDFRELVKELAQTLKIKIEMRQIGVRDEARRLGGVGPCGRTLCCCTFLKDFVSVSIRMAKDQNVSLNPSKVSGICGRLMCCLSYEYNGPKPKRKTLEEKPAEGEGVCAPAGEKAGCPAGEACGGCAPAETRTPAAAPRPISFIRSDRPHAGRPQPTNRRPDANRNSGRRHSGQRRPEQSSGGRPPSPNPGWPRKEGPKPS